MKRNVFSCLLKEAREVAVVTLVGRLFHVMCDMKKKTSVSNWQRYCFTIEKNYLPLLLQYRLPFELAGSAKFLHFTILGVHRPLSPPP